MKLYYAVGTCSMAIHILLEEIGEPYEKHCLRFATDDQKQPAYLAVNPKGKVPALQTDQHGVLTEMPAIAFYLAKMFPKAGLLPEDTMAQVRALETMEYVAATVHMRGFSRLSRPANFSADGDPELVRREGLNVIETGLRILDAQLGKRDYFLGDYSIVDAVVYIVEHWAGVRGVELPANLRAHHQRLLARPAVQRMLEAEKQAAAAA